MRLIDADGLNHDLDVFEEYNKNNPYYDHAIPIQTIRNILPRMFSIETDMTHEQVKNLVKATEAREKTDGASDGWARWIYEIVEKARDDEFDPVCGSTRIAVDDQTDVHISVIAEMIYHEPYKDEEDSDE